jgi:hypothetical protein
MKRLLLWAALVLAGPAFAAGEDPLTVQLRADDARRFAKAFEASHTSAAELQAEYLTGAGRGVEIFTPGRIRSAEVLAASVAKRSADYAHAIRTCLPLVDSLNEELRATYLAYRGLLPELPLPSVYLVFGAGNSGGTAAPDAQVLGLEVMCRSGVTPEAFRASMRSMFAHETAHTWQREPNDEPRDFLLYAALGEGTPDLLARIVSGRQPSAEREAWARGREAEIWRRFEADRAIVLRGEQPAKAEAMRRWFGNYGDKFPNLPQGWPSELGYWVGMNIAQAYLDKAPDQRAALRELLRNSDPAALLRASAYAPR